MLNFCSDLLPVFRVGRSRSRPVFGTPFGPHLNSVPVFEEENKLPHRLCGYHFWHFLLQLAHWFNFSYENA